VKGCIFFLTQRGMPDPVPVRTSIAAKPAGAQVVRKLGIARRFSRHLKPD